VTGGEAVDALRHLWIVGPGRVGLSLGGALLARGVVARITFSGRAGSPPIHPLFDSPRVDHAPLAAVAGSGASLVLIAVADGEIARVSEELAALRLPSELPVLHTSGALGSELLGGLRELGHPTGSLHPLVSLPDPTNGAPRLVGTWFGVEGEPDAVTVAERIVAGLDGHPLRVASEGKALYHAAAVLSSNYVTTLLAVAERLFLRAGVESEAARQAAVALAGGAVENAGLMGPARALTGPIVRGDLGTVRLHLQQLSASERSLYSVLARHTLDLAREAGLPEEAGAALVNLLEEEV
jgi:predicted short-subunit dehydrogenase-like oxidoreductase (DUF2520 family)